MPRLVNMLILLWVAGASLTLAWEESCGNPVVFCYRISREIQLRRADIAPLAQPLAAQTECSIPSDPFSTPSTTSRV